MRQFSSLIDTNPNAHDRSRTFATSRSSQDGDVHVKKRYYAPSR
jgi:hypothetical protein